ncbi:MAG: choice-of-anchor D domain-containing protein [Bradymonadales bacterium]|nr:choice-of-anchor D domain-containing protein [Bradymonadales bacterium]
MTRWLCFSLVGLAASLALAAVGLGCSDEIVTVGAADIRVSPDQISFEQVPLGSRAEQQVTVGNRGTANLIIANLEVVANTPDLKLGSPFPGRIEIPPDEEIQITVVWEPQEVIRASGELVIDGNDPVRPTVRIPIATTILAPFVVVRPAVIDFGRVVENTTNTIPVSLTNQGSAPLVISDISLTGSFDYSAPDLDELTFPLTLPIYDADVPTQHNLVFDVEYSPGSPGYDEGEIVVTYNAPDGTNFRASIQGEAGLSDLMVNPNLVDFGYAPLGMPSNRTITLTNTGTLPLQLNHIYLDPESSDAFELINLPQELTVEEGSLALQSGNPLPFVVRYTPTLERSDSGRILIAYTDASQSRTETATVYGIGVDNRCPVAVARGYIRDDPLQRRSNQIDWATPTDILVLDGSASFDPDGQITRYEWEISRVPPGTTTQLEPLAGFPLDDSRRQFFIPLSGRYEFTLKVFDNLDFQDCGEPALVTVISVPDETVHLELSWHNPLDPDESDDTGSDADLHLVKVGYNWFDPVFDCYYANQSPNWQPELPSLDIDDTDGAGPENIQMDNPLDCQWYAVGVHYFRKDFGTAYADIRVYIDAEQTAELLYRPLSNTDDFWDVGRLHWPSGQFFAVDEIYSNFDSSTAIPPAVDPEMIEMVAGGPCQ